MGTEGRAGGRRRPPASQTKTETRKQLEFWFISLRLPRLRHQDGERGRVSRQVHPRPRLAHVRQRPREHPVPGLKHEVLRGEVCCPEGKASAAGERESSGQFAGAGAAAEATTRKSTTEDPEEDEEKSSSSSLKSCPGVCVANRISCFCEAILDVDHLCKADLRCCVAKKVFDDKE